MSLSVGEKLEYRVANIAFHQEYFVRRRVSVSALFYPDKVSVTDIDAFGKNSTAVSTDTLPYGNVVLVMKNQ